MLLCLPLGMLFRIVFHPRRVSASVRRLLGLVWGLALSWFCFSVVFVSAGIAREESHLTDEQRKGKLKKVPPLLEYFSYLFHYSTILAGPVCTFKEFNDFIDGSDIRPKKPGEKEPSPLMDFLKKMLSGFLCVVILFLTGEHYLISKNADPKFIASEPFYWRVIYGWISGTVAKLRYYFAFKVGQFTNESATTEHLLFLSRPQSGMGSIRDTT